MNKIHFPPRGTPAYVEMQKLLASKEYLSSIEAAIFLGVSIHTIYKLISSKAIPFSKPGGKIIKIQMTHLLEWLQKNTVNYKQTIAKKTTRYFLN
jgi:excisionase family DNA binding protein